MGRGNVNPPLPQNDLMRVGQQDSLDRIPWPDDRAEVAWQAGLADEGCKMAEVSIALRKSCMGC